MEARMAYTTVGETWRRQRREHDPRVAAGLARRDGPPTIVPHWPHVQWTRLIALALNIPVWAAIIGVARHL